MNTHMTRGFEPEKEPILDIRASIAPNVQVDIEMQGWSIKQCQGGAYITGHVYLQTCRQGNTYVPGSPPDCTPFFHPSKQDITYQVCEITPFSSTLIRLSIQH